MKCPHCDKQISDDSKFCMFCGGEIVKEEPKEEIEETISIKCSKCGAEVRKDALFCPVCGNKLVEEKIFCPRCGKENSCDADFCVVCNHSLQKYKNKTDYREDPLAPAMKAQKQKMEPSIIFGIISICVVIITCMIPFASSIAGIILGIIGLTKALKSETGESKNIAITLNIIGIIINIVAMILVIIMFREMGNISGNDPSIEVCKILLLK